MTDLATLRSVIGSPVFLPEDEGFADSSAGFNLAVRHQPDAVVAVASAADVAAVVRYAREHGLRVHVQATGHGAEAPIRAGILVTTGALDEVVVDPVQRVATVGAGVRWGAVVAAAAEFGLAPITGSSPTVGVVGLVTGGGLGPLARSHGFASDYVRGFTVVTGSGEIVEATATENPDLFWALRGGKTGLGIVVQARVGLVELETLYAGSLVFAEEHIETAARAWADWTIGASDQVTTSIAVMRFPDLDVMPPPLRGRTVLMLHFTYPGEAEEGERLAAPLRSAAPVYLDSLGVLAARDIARVHNDPTEPGNGWASGALLGSIDQDFMTAWLGAVGPGKQVPAIMSELRHLGAATRTDVEGGSAAGGRPAGFALSFIGAPDPALFAGPVPAAADALYAAVAPWLAAETNVNFVAVRRPGQTGQPWSPGTTARLEAVRRDYDPDGVFG